ncbi:MAG TPA: lipid-A-disaccharide synthase N-terminal domain-containing protein [Gammaproteobacteria bacterium]|nr:lipid-A-disaccharide synthase N-terminal domain-containing protein [Gammaproteobacteria bacterium]
MTDSSGFLQPLIGQIVPWLYANSVVWTAVGLLGNALFGSRFFIQWLSSERSKKLVVPPIFWHLSFWGSLISLVYALHIDKVPFILGYVFLPIIYGRNLIFLRRTQTSTSGK